MIAGVAAALGWLLAIVAIILLGAGYFLGRK